MSHRELFIVAKNIYFIEPEQKLEHSERKHTHAHPHIYTHSSRSAHYWTSKVKTSLHLRRREQELLFQAGSGSWFSVVAFVFSLLPWIDDSVQKWSRGADGAWEGAAPAPPSRAGQPALVRLVNPPLFSLVVCFRHLKSQVTAVLLFWREYLKCWLRVCITWGLREQADVAPPPPFPLYFAVRA